MRNVDVDEELLDESSEDEGMYLNEEELLENDEISPFEEAFIKGYGSA